VLWRRLDRPGHEAARLLARGGGWELSGTAVFDQAGAPCCLAYSIECGPEWLTHRATVSGWAGNHTIRLEIETDSAGRWLLDRAPASAVFGCLDLDLAFSPSTNLLPIRRLNLAIGQASEVRAAWLRFPELELEPLDQRYTRLDDRTYRYESAGGTFMRILRTNAAGFVLSYPGLWEAVER
jgi:hypothetical protein